MKSVSGTRNGYASCDPGGKENSAQAVACPNIWFTQGVLILGDTWGLLPVYSLQRGFPC